jgi:hypothetical protein
MDRQTLREKDTQIDGQLGRVVQRSSKRKRETEREKQRGRRARPVCSVLTCSILQCRSFPRNVPMESLRLLSPCLER